MILIILHDDAWCNFCHSSGTPHQQKHPQAQADDAAQLFEELRSSDFGWMETAPYSYETPCRFCCKVYQVLVTVWGGWRDQGQDHLQPDVVTYTVLIGWEICVKCMWKTITKTTQQVVQSVFNKLHEMPLGYHDGPRAWPHITSL